MNFRDFINETSSADLDYTPTGYQSLASRDNYKNNNSHDYDDFKDEFTEYGEDIVTADELIDTINHMDDETKSIIISALNAYFGDDNNIPFYHDINDLIDEIKNMPEEYLYNHAEVIGSVLADIENQVINLFDDFNSTFEQDLDNAFNETIIDVSHTKQLRRNRKRSSWKREQILRARYRKTGKGKLEKKKALKYLKKYRKRKKAKLSRYSAMYQKRWKGDTSN